MPKALFRSINLIGDGLCIRPALYVWHQQHLDWEIDLFTIKNHATIIYSHFGIPLNVITEESELRPPYDFEHTFNCSAGFALSDAQKVHMVQSYGTLLGVNVGDTPTAYIPDEDDHEKDLVLLSPFSMSCTSQEKDENGNLKGKPPNKMLPPFMWSQIVPLARSYGRIAVLGGPEDRMPLQVGEEEYFTGIPLNTVALMMRDARLIITLDNGMAHLANTQKTPMVEFYPTCLGLHFMVPWKCKDHALILTVDPATAMTSQVVHGLRKGLDYLATKGMIKTHLFSR